MLIETKRLKLFPASPELLQKAIEGNDALEELFGVKVPEQWTEFGPAALQYALDRLNENEGEKLWWTYFPVHREDNTLVGSGGYKGGPTAEGSVEIGYEIAANYRHKGLATEMAKALVENAFKNELVSSVIAHTLGKESPSTKVLQKCGFKKTEDIVDPEEGLIWKWELKK